MNRRAVAGVAAVAVAGGGIGVGMAGAQTPAPYYPIPTYPVPSTTTTTTTPPGTFRLASKLSLKVTPSRDRKSPYKYKSTGTLSFQAGIPKALVCNGKVRITLKRGTKTLSSRLVSISKSSCKYTLTTSVKIKGLRKSTKLKASARFQGNQYLLPKSASSRTVRAK